MCAFPTITRGQRTIVDMMTFLFLMRNVLDLKVKDLMVVWWSVSGLCLSQSHFWRLHVIPVPFHIPSLMIIYIRKYLRLFTLSLIIYNVPLHNIFIVLIQLLKIPSYLFQIFTYNIMLFSLDSLLSFKSFGFL